jgi:hypothetical protein
MTGATGSARVLFWLQGVYFAVTGVWPLVHMPSFLAVTGPKHDLWLVQTVGAILAVIGVTFCVAGASSVPGAAAYVLAVGSAAALMAVDTVFTAQRIISPIYLLDAAAECVLLVAWLTLGALALRGRWRGRGFDPKHLALAWR